MRRALVTLSVAILVVVGPWSFRSAAEESDLLPPERWPTSVSEVVTDILRRMPDQDKERVRTTKREDLIMFHHGWGTGIRNYYGLWRGNEKLIVSACGKPCHPDDASMVIIDAVWVALQK